MLNEVLGGDRAEPSDVIERVFLGLAQAVIKVSLGPLLLPCGFFVDVTKLRRKVAGHSFLLEALGKLFGNAAGTKLFL